MTVAWGTVGVEDDSQYIVAAMKQIAKEAGLLTLGGPDQDEFCFSDFSGKRYDAETSAQSAILQRAATLKEFAKEQGYVRLS